MTHKSILTLLSVLLLCLSLGSCKKDEPDKKIKLHVALQQEIMLVGQTQQLDVMVLPAGTAYSCESSDSKIVTVTKEGLITAVALGKADVKVTAGDVTESVTVSVETIDKSRYLGLDASDEDKEYYAPIYIPTRESFLPHRSDLFKAAMEPFGWKFERYSEDPESKVLYYFASPRKVDANGKENPEEPKYCMDAVVYFHSPEGAAPVHIRMVANKLYPKDYMVDPSEFTSPQDLDIQKAFLAIVKHYGFTEDARFTKLAGDSAYEAYNKSFDPAQPLRGVMYTVKQGHNYELYFQIDYTK